MNKRLLGAKKLTEFALGVAMALAVVGCERAKPRSHADGARLQLAITLPTWEPAKGEGPLSLLNAGPGYAPVHLSLSVESAKGVHFKGVLDLKNPVVSLDVPFGAVDVSAAFLAVPLQPGQTLEQFCELRRTQEPGARGTDPYLTSVAGGKFEITPTTEELPLRFEALKKSAWKPLPLVVQRPGGRPEGEAEALVFRDGITGQALIPACETQPTAVRPDEQGRVVLNVPLVEPASLLRLSLKENDFDFLPALVRAASGTPPLPHRVDLALQTVVPVADTFDFFNENLSVRRKLEQGFSLLRPVPNLSFTPEVRPVGNVRLKLANRDPLVRYLCSSGASMPDPVDCLERFEVLVSQTQAAPQQLPVFVRVEDAQGGVSKPQALVVPLPALPGKPRTLRRIGSALEASLTWEPVEGALFCEIFVNEESKPLTSEVANIKFGGTGLPIATASALEVRVRAVSALGRGDFEIFRNAPPPAPVVSVSPSIAGKFSTLTCTASGSTDADGDAVTYSYSWFKKGTVIAGQTSSTLAGQFVANDDIVCKASAGDGIASSEAVASGTVNIQNTAPTAPSSVILAPTTAGKFSTLTCSAAGSLDVDGDTVTSLTYWFKGITLMNGQTGSTLSGQFVKGDSITCKVQASDGALSSSLAESNTVTIQNTAPSAPSAVTVTSTVPTRAGTFMCGYAGGSDADGDTLVPVYAWQVNGTAVSGQTSSMLSGSHPDVVVGGNVTCAVALNDTVATGSAMESAGVTVQNTAPTISAIENVLSHRGETSPAVAFTIEDLESTLSCSASSLTVTSNSNDALIPSSNITFEGTAPNCTMVLMPDPNLTGSSSLVLSVSDGSLSAQSAFTFTVDGSTLTDATFGTSGTRRAFFDATTGRHWGFVAREAGTSHTIYIENSSDGATWTSVTALTNQSADFAVTARDGSVYLASSTGSAVTVRAGTLSANAVSFAAPVTVFTATGGDRVTNPVTVLNGTGQLWVGALHRNALGAQPQVRRSTNAAIVSLASWQAPTSLGGRGQAPSMSLVPRTGDDLYLIVQREAVEGFAFSGGAWSAQMTGGVQSWLERVSLADHGFGDEFPCGCPGHRFDWEPLRRRRLHQRWGHECKPHGPLGRGGLAGPGFGDD